MQFDFHIHSHFSYDSFQSPERIVRTAARRSLDAIAVTDHDRLAGAAAVSALDTELICVRGMEIRTDEVGDILGLFLTSEVESRRFDEVVDEIHDQGAIAVLPHPFRHYETLPDGVLERVDAIEGLNARSKAARNERARQLGTEHDIPMLGGSDAHTSFEIGRARSVVPDTYDASKEGIRAAIRAGDLSVRGTETPYYLSHGASVLMERIKSKTGLKRRRTAV